MTQKHKQQQQQFTIEGRLTTVNKCLLLIRIKSCLQNIQTAMQKPKDYKLQWNTKPLLSYISRENIMYKFYENKLLDRSV